MQLAWTLPSCIALGKRQAIGSVGGSGTRDGTPYDRFADAVHAGAVERTNFTMSGNDCADGQSGRRGD